MGIAFGVLERLYAQRFQFNRVVQLSTSNILHSVHRLEVCHRFLAPIMLNYAQLPGNYTCSSSQKCIRMGGLIRVCNYVKFEISRNFLPVLKK